MSAMKLRGDSIVPRNSMSIRAQFTVIACIIGEGLIDSEVAQHKIREP